MSKLVKIILILYVGLVLLNALLLPPLNIISIDNFLFPFALLGVVSIYYTAKCFQASLVLVGLIVTCSLLSNYMNDGLTGNEFLWSIRSVKLFTVGWSVYYFSKKKASLFQNFIMVSFLGFGIINAMELLEWQSILELYAPSNLSVTALQNAYFDGRLFGVTSNPNSNGLILALFGFYFYLMKGKYMYHLISIVSLLILMTQSRTAFIAFVISFGVVLFFQIIKKRKRVIFIFLGIVTTILIVLANLKLTNLSSLFNGTAFKSHSFLSRFDIVNQVVEINDAYFWFGRGIIKDIPTLVGGSIDNEYAYVYLSYGMIGLLLLFLTITLLIFFVIKNKSKLYVIGLILIMFICGITNLSFSNIEVSALFILLFAATFIEKSKINQNYNTEK